MPDRLYMDIKEIKDCGYEKSYNGPGTCDIFMVNGAYQMDTETPVNETGVTRIHPKSHPCPGVLHQTCRKKEKKTTHTIHKKEKKLFLL